MQKFKYFIWNMAEYMFKLVNIIKKQLMSGSSGPNEVSLTSSGCARVLGRRTVTSMLPPTFFSERFTSKQLARVKCRGSARCGCSPLGCSWDCTAWLGELLDSNCNKLCVSRHNFFQHKKLPSFLVETSEQLLCFSSFAPLKPAF